MCQNRRERSKGLSCSSGGSTSTIPCSNLRRNARKMLARFVSTRIDNFMLSNKWGAIHVLQGASIFHSGVTHHRFGPRPSGTVSERELFIKRRKQNPNSSPIGKGSDLVLMVRQTGPGSRIFSQPVLIGGFELLDLVQAGKGGAAHLGREGQA